MSTGGGSRSSHHLPGDGNFGAARLPASSKVAKPGRSQPRKIISGGRVRSRRGGRLVIERGRDVADADDADQAVVVDHRQMANVVLVHQMANMLERINR